MKEPHMTENDPIETPPSDSDESVRPVQVEPEEAVTADTPDPLADQIATLEAAVAAEKDRYLRAHAEFENTKRRREQEMADFHKYATEKLIKAILPVLDSFELAIHHAESMNRGEDEIVSGFILIRKQIDTFLDKLEVKKITSVDQPFDPHLHQAVSQETAEGKAPQTVIREMQCGYQLHDRLIRPAMVVVAA